MGKEGGCVGLGQKGLREGGGNCLKHLKRWWEKKEGRQNKDFKKGWQAGSRGECLKKGGGGLEPPYELCIFVQIYNFLGMLKLRET